MKTTLVLLYRGQPGVAATLLYTCPAFTTARILAFTVCNDTTTAVTYTIYIVPSGGSAGVTNLLVSAETLGSNESEVVSRAIGHVLEAGTMIYALASSAAQVTMTISGQKIEG